MKFLIKTILIALVAYFILPYSPWWIIPVLTFIICALIKSDWFTSFISGFIAIGALWFYKAWSIDKATDSILTTKIASLFTLSEPIMLILVTALAGAIAAGFGGLTGHTFRKLFEKKKSAYY